jgi:hypothetical protein
MTIMCAAGVAGFVLGELLLHGWAKSNALIVALVIGVVLALPAIVAISRSFSSARSISIKEPIATAVLNITGDQVAYTFQANEQANAFTTNHIAV